MNGSFQYFDNTFLWDRADYRKPTLTEYPSSTLFGYLQTHHPKWLLVLQRAQRQDLFGFQPYASSFTMFVPMEESLDDNMIVNLDKSQACQMFDYHTLRGKYAVNVLNTSKFQHLNTLIDGQYIYYMSTQDGEGGILNRRETIVEKDKVFGNVIVHILSGLL